MPDPMFERLYHESDKLHWPLAASIRRRGQRARQRQLVLVATVTALVLLAGGTAAAFAVGQPERSPVPPATAPPSDPPATRSPAPEPSGPPSQSPTPSQTSTEVPVAAMLQPEDLPPANWVVSDDTDGDWTFFFLASGCNNRLGSGWPSPIDIRERALRDRPPGQNRGASILENVYWFEPGDAEGFLDFVRRQVQQCGGYRTTAGLSIEDERFAGEESLLVRAGHEGGESLLVLVRQGDLVAEFKPASGVEPLRLAERAADRLCAAAAC